MCKVPRELKKEEAIKRMQVLGIYKPCIKAFKDRNEVQLSEMTGGLYEFSGNSELTEKVREFEKEYNALVYHVIHTFTQFGELYNFLKKSGKWIMQILKTTTLWLMYGIKMMTGAQSSVLLQ